MLYKVLRAPQPIALFHEFNAHDVDLSFNWRKDGRRHAFVPLVLPSNTSPIKRSYELEQKIALEDYEQKSCANSQQDINWIESHNQLTLLHKAVADGHILVVQRILSLPEYDVNAQDVEGVPPLYYAARGGQSQIAGLLLKCERINPNQATKTSGDTPLHIAAAKGFVVTVQALLAHPAIDVNAAKMDGTTALYVAAQQGQEYIVALLLSQKKINTNCTRKSDGTTPLYAAVCHGHSSIVGQLCAKVSLFYLHICNIL
jgi:ankyrin repeat protein